MKSLWKISLLIFFAFTVQSCRKNEDWIEGKSRIIPFNEFNRVQCFRLKSGCGLVLVERGGSTLLSDAGFVISLVEKDDSRVVALSFFGFIDKQTKQTQKFYLFSVAENGDRYLVLPTVFISDPNIVYYRDSEGIHEIPIVGVIDENILPPYFDWESGASRR